MRRPSSRRDPLSRLHRPLAVATALAVLALVWLPAAPAWAGSNRAHLDRELVKRIQQGQKVRVILVAHGELNGLEAELRRSGVKKTLRVPIGHGIAAELTPSMIDHFRGDPKVERIIYDAPLRLRETPFDASALLSAYPAVVDAVRVWNDPRMPLTGKNIGIAVIDSGMASHPDFNDRLGVSRNFNPALAGNGDDYGHGTAVGGIIAGDGEASAGRYVGVAPGANLINLRVNDGSGAAPTSVVMNAILWAVKNKDTFNIRVINLSLLSSVQESYRTSTLDAAVEYAWLKGIVVVVAAGNSGANSALYAPANDPYVITVGAADDHGTLPAADDTLTSFSAYGLTQDGIRKPDLVAPGRHLVTTLAPNSSFALNHPAAVVDGRYIQLSGTSVAAPVVSGVAALYVENHPGARPGQVKSVLMATANRLSFAGSGAGYPDTARAVAQVGLARTADRGLQPNNYLKVLYMEAHHLSSLPAVSWDSVSWDSVSWDSVSWDSVSWDAVSWSD
jgi:serine protease AprX